LSNFRLQMEPLRNASSHREPSRRNQVNFSMQLHTLG
jgi:hypothetical protein